jgi:broad specificity phosphatase PhoE
MAMAVNAMKISLLRHGQPVIDFSTRIRAAGFRAWLDAYEAAGIDRSLPPPLSLTAALAGCGLVATSPTRRAVESAELLRLPTQATILPSASEIPLPTRLHWPVALRPGTLVVAARILWFLKLARATEDRRQAALRVQNLARDLNRHAKEKRHVALVGHGYTNLLLGKVLTAEGWRTVTRPRHGYWSCTHYEKV